MGNVFILTSDSCFIVNSYYSADKMPFFTVYLFDTGRSVWPRSVKGNFSWKNSSKLNKVINEETAFKFVTAWEESYDVITRQLSIRQYTFMKKGSLFKWKTARSWIYFNSSSCESAFTENIHWRITQKVNDFHVCFQFTKVNLHNYLGENYSMETNLWANYYFSEFQCLAFNNWYSEMGVKWGKDMLSYGG